MQRIATNNGLIGLYGYAGNLAEQPAGRIDLLRNDIAVTLIEIFSCFQCHDYLFQSGVPRPLAYAVYGTFYLPRSLFQRCE